MLLCDGIKIMKVPKIRMDIKVKKQKIKKRHSKKRNKIGFILSDLQGIASLIAIIAFIKLNLLPTKFLVPIILSIALLWVLTFTSARVCRKRVAAGNILSVVLSIVLLSGAFYLFKTNGMLNKISAGDKKVDKMVVAVLVDDSAKTIKDVKDYKFGIQLALKGNDVKDTIEEINSKVNKKVTTVECANLNEQVEALFDNKVQAIVYNDAYTSILEESFKDFRKKIKIIYSHEIVNKLDKVVLTKEEKEVSKHPFTVYLSGIDVTGSIETTGRSDVNILAVVNPQTHQVLLVTTPRDYYIELPGISDGMPDKLTHAGIYGVDASMAALSELYDTSVDFYARINFTSMEQIVDALGGVDVDSEQEFIAVYDNGDEMEVAKGINHFNGKQALMFCRERNHLDDGDFQRGRNQQATITAMIKKALSPAILKGASEILDSVSGNVDTNMSTKQIQALIKSQMVKPASWNIKSVDAKGTPSFEYCFSMPTIELSVCSPDYDSVEEIQKMIDQVQNGEKIQVKTKEKTQGMTQESNDLESNDLESNDVELNDLE